VTGLFSLAPAYRLRGWAPRGRAISRYARSGVQGPFAWAVVLVGIRRRPPTLRTPSRSSTAPSTRLTSANRVSISRRTFGPSAPALSLLRVNGRSAPVPRA